MVTSVGKLKPIVVIDLHMWILTCYPAMHKGVMNTWLPFAFLSKRLIVRSSNSQSMYTRTTPGSESMYSIKLKCPNLKLINQPTNKLNYN